MKKITLCIQKIAGLSGGAEKVLVDLANQLWARGFSVDILSYEDTGGEPFFYLSPGIVCRNIKPYDDRRRARAWRNSLEQGSIEFFVNRIVSVIDRTPYLCRFSWNRRYRRMIDRLQQFIDWHAPDVMICFMPGISTYVIAARQKSAHKPSVIISNHNVPEADFESLERWDRNRYDRYLRRLYLRKAEAVTVLLPEYRDWFTSEEQLNMHVIGNAIVPLKTIPNDNFRDNAFISIGRLTKTKNHEALIRAFAQIHAKIPSWSVRIFGIGPLRMQLESVIRELDIEKNVHLLGRSDQINEELVLSKVMILPSLHEGFPLVLGESFAAGVPVIGFSDCSGVNRLIRDGENGILVNGEGDRQASLAQAMEAIATDDSLRRRLSEGALADAQFGNYSVDRIFGEWESLILSVIR